MLTSRSDLRHQTSHAFLELAVLGGVDQRVDATVGEHKRHGQVVPPASKVERVAEIVAKEQDLDRRPACEKYAANYEPGDKCIASFGNCRVTGRIYLKEINLCRPTYVSVIAIIIGDGNGSLPLRMGQGGSVAWWYWTTLSVLRAKNRRLKLSLQL